MLSLREHIKSAVSNKTAIGHFNACTIDGIWAIADAAKEMNLPVIVGASEGERDYVGVRQLAAIVKSIREERGQAIFLNADHTYSFERVKEAIDIGFDSVIFDGAQLPMNENIIITKKCVDYARSCSQKNGRDILIEGELGYIGTSSKMLNEIPAGAITKEEHMTKPEDALRFVRETGVHMLAPAVGNVHGIIRGGDPVLNIKRIGLIGETVAIPLVLHGASGNSAEDIRGAIKAGIAIVHVNTELRLAYRAGLMKSLSEDTEEISPYKYLKPAKLAMRKVVEEKLKIVSGL
ncbi:MAG: class II fructose-bisphosphate aldolase [Patescibacteria group bacterium]